MNKKDLLRILKSLFLVKIPKAFLLYVLIPLLCLIFLAQPVRDAVRASDAAAFYILLAASAAVALNWLAYRLIRRKHPSLLVFSWGTLCLLLVSLIEYDALPGFYPLASTLSYICAFFALVFLFLLSYWFAIRNTKPARTAAIILRIILALIFWGVVYQIYREIESRNMTADTWITIGFLLVLLLGFNVPRLLPLLRRKAALRKASGLASGIIVQIIGETSLDREDDLITRYYARIEYSVDDMLYETKAGISKHTVRRFGKEAFIDLEVPVHYNPDDPARTIVDRIDKRLLDDSAEEQDNRQDETRQNPAE